MTGSTEVHTSLIDSELRADMPAVFYNSNIRGNIDSFSDGCVRGWIKYIDRDDPIYIDVFLNGRPIVEGLRADIRRTDLIAAGYDNGVYGFEVSYNENVAVSNIKINASGQHELLLYKSNNALQATQPSDITRLTDTTSLENNAEVELPAVYKIKIEQLTQEFVRGWAVDNNDTGRLFQIDIFINGAHFSSVRNDKRRGDLLKKGISSGMGGFSADLPLALLSPGQYHVSIRLPNGVESSDTIDISNQNAVKHENYGGFSVGFDRGISVIVPIFNAADDVSVCIRRILKHTPDYVDVILINDCSTEPAVAKILSKIPRDGRMRIFTNEINLGFTATVNRGIRYAGTNDVIFLNSDARVTPRWIEGLRNAAYSRAKIATVTAMSDRAGPFSAPKLYDNALMDGVSEERFARAFRRSSLGIYPSVPTGNGFCLYVRRECINMIGALDEYAFPRGYGEENDFCMRAMRAGWQNIVDDRTYVFHERSRSFGHEKDELIEAGRAVLNERYPDYTFLVRSAFAAPQFSTIRFNAALALNDCSRSPELHKRILYVISTKTGGTPQTNEDLIRALSDSYDCWLLHSDASCVELSRYDSGEFVSVEKVTLSYKVNPLTHRSSHYDEVLNDWMIKYDFDILHIRHIAWHSLELINVAKMNGVKVVFSFHDYYTLSPTVKLIDDRGIFRGNEFDNEPSIFRQSLWGHGTQPSPHGSWLSFWKEQMESELLRCDAYVTTSLSARDIILSEFGEINPEKFSVIPHGRDFSEMAFFAKRPEPGEILKILVPGNIDAAKGLEIIYELLRIDEAGRLEFHILGDMNMRGKSDHPKIIRHGRYKRSQFVDKVSEIRPHFGAIFSIWNETYCHTLTELWSAGIPAFAFDFPTVASRIRDSGGGWILPHDDVGQLLVAIENAAGDLVSYDAAVESVKRWQQQEGANQTTDAMAQKYTDIYETICVHDK